MTDETRRKIDKAVKISLVIAGILLICNDVYHRYGGSSRADVHQDTTRAVERIQAEHQSAASEIKSAGISINDAEGHVERAADAVGRSEEAARINAAGVDELQKLISECQTIVRRQQDIIQDVDRANGTGAPEGKED